MPQTNHQAGKERFWPAYRAVICVTSIILVWRWLLFAFFNLPVPTNDAFFYDCPAIWWVDYGRYVVPVAAEVFPISGTEVFSAYPPLYQFTLILWLTVFGTSAQVTIAFHLFLVSLGTTLVVAICWQLRVRAVAALFAVLFTIGITFHDRPDDLAHVWGLISVLCFTLHRRRPGGANLRALMTAGLLACFFTAPVAGAIYFIALACASFADTCLAGRQLIWRPFVLVAVLFWGIVLAIALLRPLWWAGFLENASTTKTVMAPSLINVTSLLKLLRTAPLFWIAPAWLGILYLRNRKLCEATESNHFPLAAGLAGAGAIVLATLMILIGSNNVAMLLYLQCLMAALLLEIQFRFWPERAKTAMAVLIVCILVLSIRLIGLSTWGVLAAQAFDSSKALALVRQEVAAASTQTEPQSLAISSAFLYAAVDTPAAKSQRVRLFHSDWMVLRYPDRSFAQSVPKTKPDKLILTQFDYYRNYTETIEAWRQKGLIKRIKVIDHASFPVPDANPNLQRVLQHISWAPVVVEVQWN